MESIAKHSRIMIHNNKYLLGINYTHGINTQLILSVLGTVYLFIAVL